jgi:uncharacterized membrane protein
LAAQFTTTGVVHFVGMRAEMISMVPPALPEPGLIITITGVLELAGAAGLLLPRTAPWAAGGLAAVLVAVYPANVSASPRHPRTHCCLAPLMQILRLAAALAVVAYHVRERRQNRSGIGDHAGRVATLTR